MISLTYPEYLIFFSMLTFKPNSANYICRVVNVAWSELPVLSNKSGVICKLCQFDYIVIYSDFLYCICMVARDEHL